MEKGLNMYEKNFGFIMLKSILAYILGTLLILYFMTSFSIQLEQYLTLPLEIHVPTEVLKLS